MFDMTNFNFHFDWIICTWTMCKSYMDIIVVIM